MVCIEGDTLVLCFPWLFCEDRAAARPVKDAGSGGGWIVTGLVVNGSF
jgi:hypothetical protein